MHRVHSNPLMGGGGGVGGGGVGCEFSYGLGVAIFAAHACKHIDSTMYGTPLHVHIRYYWHFCVAKYTITLECNFPFVNSCNGH